MSILIANRSDYPTAEVRRLVRRTLRWFEVGDVAVTVSHRRRSRRDPEGSYSGGHYSPTWYPDRGEDREQIRVTLPRPDLTVGAYWAYERRQPGPCFLLADWREALVAIVAHEGMHHLQTPRNGYGQTRGRFVEAECDWAAFRAVGYLRGELGLSPPEALTRAELRALLTTTGDEFDEAAV